MYIATLRIVMKKRYAHLALMMTSMMSSQLLWGAQATAAEFKDVRHTSWLRSNADNILFDQVSLIQMQEVSKRLKRSVEEIFKNFETTRIIPESTHNFTHVFFHVLSIFLVRQYMPAPCSITAANVPQTPANMKAIKKAINIILDDPRSKIREFCAQNPDSSWQLGNLDDVQLLHIMEKFGFFRNQRFMDRLNDLEIRQKWQDRDRLGIGFYLIKSLSAPVTVDNITRILEQVDNIKKEDLCWYRPIISALSCSITTTFVDSMISEIGKNEQSLLQDERDLLCSYFVAHSKILAGNDMSYIIDAVNTIPEKHHATFKAFIEKSLKWSIPAPINMKGYISALENCFESIPDKTLKNLNFVETCGHFIRLVSKRKYSKLSVGEVICIIKAVSGLSNWKSEAVSREDSISFAEAQAIYTNLRCINIHYHDDSRICLMTAFFPKFSLELLQSQNFITFCNLFINEIGPKYIRADQRIESALALFPEHSFKDERFINNFLHFMNKIPQQGVFDVEHIIKAVDGISGDPFNDKRFIETCLHFMNKIPRIFGSQVELFVKAVDGISSDRLNGKRFIEVCDFFIDQIPQKDASDVVRIVKAVAGVSNDSFIRFHYILGYFLKRIQTDRARYRNVHLAEMVEVVAGISDAHLNNERFIIVCDQFINRFGVSNICDIIKDLSQLSTSLFDDKEGKNLLRNQKIINDHMRASATRYPDRYKTVNK